MADIEAIDRVDWRDYATPAEMEEAYATMAGLYDAPEREIVEPDWSEYGYDPDDRYGDLREYPPTYFRISGNIYKS
jgi:hypothetical protein